MNTAKRLLTHALDFVILGRPHFLLGGLLLHGLGVVMARYTGTPVNVPLLIWGQVIVTAIQLATAYSNDFFDLSADQANLTPGRWSGGSRVLPERRLPPWAALAAALILSLLAIAATVILALSHRLNTLALAAVAVALLLSWAYSAPPVRLHSRGLGELTGALLVTGLTPLFSFYLQAGKLIALPLLAVAPLCCLGFTMLMSVAFPDAISDAATGKRTLVVRLGGARAARLYDAVLLATYAALPVLVLAGLPALVAIAVALPIPLATWHGWRLWRGAWAKPTRLNVWTSCGIALLLLGITGELLAFLLSTPTAFSGKLQTFLPTVLG